MPRLRAGIAVVLALIAVSGAVSLAQRFGVIEGAGAGIRVPPKDFNDGGFTICKWMFRSDRSEPGGIGWSTDYPFGEINLLTRLSELTKIHVSRDSGGDVNYWVVRLTDDQLFECPMLIGSDVGTAALSNTEVQRLRQYLLKGGFLWVDDFWGTPAWDQWSRPDQACAAGVPDCRRGAGRSDPAGTVHHHRGQAGAQHLLVGRARQRPERAGERQSPRRFPRHRRWRTGASWWR